MKVAFGSLVRFKVPWVWANCVQVTPHRCYCFSLWDVNDGMSQRSIQGWKHKRNSGSKIFVRRPKMAVFLQQLTLFSIERKTKREREKKP